jgi:hypothetical protein
LPFLLFELKYLRQNKYIKKTNPKENNPRSQKLKNTRTKNEQIQNEQRLAAIFREAGFGDCAKVVSAGTLF